MRWFTTYSGYRWTPEKGYNELFASYVTSIREHFKMRKTNVPGVEKSTSGEWIPHVLQGRRVSVILDRFEWKHYIDDKIVFALHLRVATKRNWLFRLFDRRTSPMNVIFDQDVLVIFTDDFPSEPPKFKILGDRYANINGYHEHHMFRGGVMCIMADSDDWDPDRDNILRAVNAALDWIVWHYYQWGF